MKLTITNDKLESVKNKKEMVINIVDSLFSLLKNLYLSVVCIIIT
jgi:hypothetical protein